MENKKMTVRQEQAVETRKKLLDSAKDLFSKVGYHKTTVRDINRNVGMADGILYHYFPGGKKEIFQVLLEENVENIVEKMEEKNRYLSDMPIEEVLEQVFKNADETFEGYPDIFGIFFREKDIWDFVKRDQLIDMFEKRRMWFPELLKKRTETGEINVIDYESAAETLMAIMMNHFFVKLAGIGPGMIGDPERRKKLIAYQVGLWKRT